jgi:hypothetical protein
MNNLFEDNGASFSDCRKYRYALWRIWDKALPLVMFIGLNPSTANENKSDATIRRVKRLAVNFGYGGFYMLNCFPYISTNPFDLNDYGNTAENDSWLFTVSKSCVDVVFAWGSFKIVKEKSRDVELKKMFPHAKALKINMDGSPMHPLYVPGNVKLVPYE